MRFEATCPTGLGGTPPHLDLLAEGDAIRAIRMFEEVRPVCGAKPRSWNMHTMLHEEDDCGAPVGGGRNGGSKLRMRQELREQHNGGTAVLEPRSFRTLLTNLDI